MTPPELRITDAEVAACPREIVVCPSCLGLGVYEGRGVVDDASCWRCNGGGEVRGDRIILDGASARIGAAIVAHLPHLRHAVWPPRRQRVDGSALATAIGLALGVGGGR